MNDKVERWGLFEEAFCVSFNGNPFTDVNLKAVFKHEKMAVETDGFYDGNDTYKIRFMPEMTGEWTYVTSSNLPSLDGKIGRFECTQPSSDNHGYVKVKDQFHFEYADGTSHYSFGTTCYAWIHQPMELQAKTLETLKLSPFNKIRMCVFPKHYDYNLNEPLLYPFEKTPEGIFDFTRPDTGFFRHLEKRILELQELGIECDLILFHPYDRWGFSDMGFERDCSYLKYTISRLAHYRNIWWSLANEYDLFIDWQTNVPKKTEDDWDRYFHIIQRYDPYQHLRSIHNCRAFYDYGKPWVTHCSIQRQDTFRTSENTDVWRNLYKKPVVIDECAYEGNINHGWGNITGEEMTRRFWEGVVRGGYMGHGETYVHPNDILWWSHGGVLHGTSPERIAFLRGILKNAPGPLTPVTDLEKDARHYWDVTCGVVGQEYYLFYFGFYQPSFRHFILPENKKYKLEIIDTWNMTIHEVPGIFSGRFNIALPSRQYIAVRITQVRK